MGCDGSHSIARQSMLRLPKFDYSQSYITTGYKGLWCVCFSLFIPFCFSLFIPFWLKQTELHIPPTSTNQHKMEKHALHIWPRGKFMMIALPNLDGSYTVTCFFPFEGEHGFDRLVKTNLQFFEVWNVLFSFFIIYRLDHAADADLFKFFKGKKLINKNKKIKINENEIKILIIRIILIMNRIFPWCNWIDAWFDSWFQISSNCRSCHCSLFPLVCRKYFMFVW